jgi:ribose-phosphate pyrophosphokinase
MNGELAVLSGNSNPGLSKEICSHLGIIPAEAIVGKFSDGETRVEVEANMRGKDAFVIQSTCPPDVNGSIMELILMIDALKRASAKRITVVMPYYGYARQDRKVKPRVPISAKVVADMLTAAGANRVIVMDLHAGQIQGFFNIPVDNLYAKPVLIKHIADNFKDNLVIVAPDAGGTERARSYAKKLNAGLALIDKRRSAPGEAEVMHVIGDVEGMRALILDDMADTFGTMVKAAEALILKGAKSVSAACTHAVLSGPAIERLTKSPVESLVVTNTIPLNAEAQMCSKIITLSVAGIIGDAIKCVHEEKSVSSLFT